MAKNDGGTPENDRGAARANLVAAAQAFDATLTRFAQLTDAVRKGTLDSRRNLERAAEVLREVAETEEQLALRAQALMSALGQARDLQQAQAEAVRERADEIQQRTTVLGELLRKYESLGESARELNVLGQRVATSRPAAGEATGLGEANTGEQGTWRVGLKELYDKMTDVASVAEELTERARQDDFEDIARQADSLRQQLLAARNKVRLLQTSIGAAPAQN